MSAAEVRSTYRIQLRDGLDLDGVVSEGWLDHAQELGVSHLYLSPVLAAVPGSSHGYDVVDPRHVDPALGGDEALVRLAAAAAERGMGLVVDIVPNHMAVDQTANVWWRDVLRNGRASLYADTFDVDWDPAEQRLRGSIFLPVLGDHYGRVLESGGIVVERRGSDLVVVVNEQDFPLEPSSTAQLLGVVADEVDDDLLHLIVRNLDRLEQDDPEVRASELRVLDPSLAQSLSHPAISGRLDQELVALNADHDRLHDLLEAQHYRLAYWRAARDLGYRRFFDVNDLIGVRVELPEVFGRTHSTIRRWIDDGLVDGLRVDHPDGLREPGRYFEQLRALAPDGWIVAEKILEPGEQLPAAWPVDGTTGYDVAETIARWFLHPEGLDALSLVRDDLVGPAPTGEELLEEATRTVLTDVLPADLNRVTDLFLRMCETLRRFRDATRHELHELVREAVTAFPVYRTYVGPGQRADEATRELIAEVLTTVRERRPDLDGEFVDLLAQVLTGDLDELAPLAVDVRMRFEQLTGPAMAKGKEDTAWYRDVRLVSRCEVGADAFAPGLGTAGLHEAFADLQRRSPRTMTGLSTHDSKRGEDVRARLAVLTEAPGLWSEFARAWLDRVDVLDREGAVDLPTRYQMCQTLVGAHPLSEDRLVAYMGKAIREAKVHTTWLQPDSDYERAVEELCRAVMADPGLRELQATFVESVIGPAGRRNAIAQKVLQLMGPGLPDLYWGSEDWWFRLVDPDNRVRPDLGRLQARVASSKVDPDDSAAKAVATRAALQLRVRHAGDFAAGAAYRPLEVSGAEAHRLAAFSRGESVIAVVSRFPLAGALVPGTTVELPAGRWIEVLSDRPAAAGRSGTVDAADLLRGWPVALLERSDEDGGN